MAYIGQFVSGEILYASEINSPFATCILNSTTTQSITTAVATTVTFANADEVRDPLGWHSDVTYPPRIYPTITGMYVVDGNVTLAANSGTGAYLQLVKNTTVVAQSSGDLSGSGAQASLSLSHTLSLSSTDYIYLAIYQNSGGSVNITAKTFSAILIGI